MVDLIIPIYNTPLKDLERCLNSVIDQTYKNYKVYLIDDGSNRNTREYLDNYTKNKNNFFVKHIKNNGVSNARNVGVELSSSKYISFIDSDDTLEKTFLEEAIYLAETNDLDIIIGGYNEIKNGNIVRTRLSLPGLHIYEGKTIDNFFEKLLTGKTNETNKEIGDCPTGRIYTRLFKRDSIGNLRFDTNIHMSEDTLFMIDYTCKPKKIGVVDRIWYNYYINDYSISNATKKERMINNINDFISEIEKRMKNESKDNIKNAYQARIEKSKKYINKIKNTNN